MIHHVERCRFGDFAARAGSCTDASFSAVFRYPPLRPFCRAAQPVDRVSSLWRNDLRSRVVARVSARPAALLGFCPSQVFSRLRVVARRKRRG
jgi:hypothetical protein